MCNYLSVEVIVSWIWDYLHCGENQLTQLNINGALILDYLVCYDNNLTTLDVSQNTALTRLSCTTNQLNSLDVTQNTDIYNLNCTQNNIQELDLSQNTALVSLDCSINQLTSLDLSQNTALTKLFFDYSPLLTCLNVKNGNNTIITDFWLNNNPNLTCIEVDDPAWSTINWTNIDPQTSFSEDCNYPSSCFSVSINELTSSKTLIQILDMMGRETTFKPNTPLIYVYDDGSTEKVFIVDY